MCVVGGGGGGRRCNVHMHVHGQRAAADSVETCQDGQRHMPQCISVRRPDVSHHPSCHACTAGRDVSNGTYRIDLVRSAWVGAARKLEALAKGRRFDDVSLNYLQVRCGSGQRAMAHSCGRVCLIDCAVTLVVVHACLCALLHGWPLGLSLWPAPEGRRSHAQPGRSRRGASQDSLVWGQRSKGPCAVHGALLALRCVQALFDVQRVLRRTTPSDPYEDEYYSVQSTEDEVGSCRVVGAWPGLLCGPRPALMFSCHAGCSVHQPHEPSQAHALMPPRRALRCSARRRPRRT